MAENILILINLFAYGFVVSQPFTYIIALKEVQMNMQPAAYIELRKLLDKNYTITFRVVIYVTLASSSLLCILFCIEPMSLVFISSALALVLLIVEILLAVKGNVPINKVINSWSHDDYPEDWEVYRNRWLAIFAKRQLVSIAGFASLLVGAVFR